MKELVEVIAKSLVDKPEEVSVIETFSDDKIILKLKVSKEDTGKIIGKQGKAARAIRAIVKSCAVKEKKKILVEII
ncbi:MAG: KH domain-containing protein [Clostridium perfringens]|nr:KH domain-containing protein [Clostridium perfringens]